MADMSLGNGSFEVANALIPAEGPRVIRAALDFGNAAQIAIDGSQVVQLGKISFIQGVFIDNASNPAALTINVETTGQRLICPANSQGYFSILAPLPPKMVASTTQAANLNVALHFYNVPIQNGVWKTV